MKNYEVPPLIKDVLKHGIEITLLLDEHGDVMYDVSTHAKSHLYIKPAPHDETLHESEIEFIGYGRYDKTYTIQNSIESLGFTVAECMCGRDFVNVAWAELLVEFGILRKKTKTTVTYTR